MKKVSPYSHANLRLSLKFTSSNHCLNLETQQEAPRQCPPDEDLSRAREQPSNQRLLSTLSTLPNPAPDSDPQSDSVPGGEHSARGKWLSP